MSEELDLALGILDHQLLDCEGRRCGKVDDLAIEGRPGESAEVVAMYCRLSLKTTFCTAPAGVAFVPNM